MPYADPENKKLWSRKAVKNGYGKWLWQKRKRIYLDAKEFRSALENVMEVGDLAAVNVASKALKKSDKRWEELGPPLTKPVHITTNREATPDSLLQALAKLGLS